MTTSLKLQELTEALTLTESDDSLQENSLEEIVSELPVLSGHKELRRISIEIFGRAPTDLVADKIQHLSKGEQAVKAADLGLALQWTDAALSSATEPSDAVKTLILSQGALLSRALYTVAASQKGLKVKQRMNAAFIHDAARSLLKLSESIRENYEISDLVDFLVKTEKVSTLVEAALIASAHKNASRPNLVTQIDQAAEQKLVKLWCAVVLNTKPADFVHSIKPLLESHVLDSFWEGTFVSQDTFDNVIVPALHKALLRAPEDVVKYVIPSLLKNKELNMDTLVASASFTSNIGSSNVQLRHATAMALGNILTHTKTPNVESLVTNFKKASNSDQRALLAHVLSKVPATVDRSSISAALASQSQKESSESSLRTIADAIVNLLPEPSAVEAVNKGLGEVRKPLLREWILALAANEGALDKLEPFKSKLTEVWTDITKNVSGAAAAKYGSSGYGLVILLDPELSSIPEPLYGSRVYEHASSERELDILSKSCAKLLAKPDGEKTAHFVLRAFAHTTTSGSAAQRLENLHRLSHVFKAVSSKQLCQAFVEVLGDIIVSKEVNVSKIVSAIPTADWLIEAFVLSHTNLAEPSKGWIHMCLNSSLDPHDLVVANADVLFSESINARNVNALATLAFVAPEIMALRIDEYLTENLRGQPISGLDAAILSTPEGQLASATTTTFSSRTKKSTNQSDEAWEEELRKEIAQKRGTLTPEQKAELDEQTRRRNELLQEAGRIEFCCALLVRLADDSARGAENGSLQWVPNGINLCLEVTEKNTPGKDAAVKCLSTLSSCLSDRFQGRWKSVAAKLLLQGQKADVTTVRSLLYMLNPVSDKRLLDPTSLVYILPIVRSVMATYDGSAEDEVADEAILLITSLLANQAEVLAVIPRGDLVSVILALIAEFAADRSAIKDCLRRVAQRVEFSEAELHMLLDASIAANQDFVRAAALEVIDAEVDLEGRNFSPEIWIARFGQFSEVAQDIWSESKMQLPPDSVLGVFEPYFTKKYVGERDSLANAFVAAALATKKVSEAYDQLQALYTLRKQPPKPIINSFGMEVKQKWADPVEERLSICAALRVLVAHLEQTEVIKCAEFIVNEGVTDKAVEASTAALELGKALIDEHGKKCVDGLLPVFSERDIVLFGFAAQHLPASDPRLSNTVEKLLAALPTAADHNKRVIVDSLGPLAARIDYHSLLDRTLEQSCSAESSELRRGAAYGFAGMARGVGLSTLGDVSIVNFVSGAVEDKKDAGRREGAMFLVIALSQVFDRLFEPYAIELMPQVLTGLGDVNPIVRDAANEAARTIMANTSAYGIKRQVPLALEQLDTTAWRGKKGAVELLGSMAYLSPQQLAASLATIVPEIVALLNDTHKEVRSSAKRSMKMFGDVIQNPEIHKLVPTLLGAISDPTQKTDSALTDLLKTRFMHYIDSPSLALIIFVVQRGLRDRSASTKRKACQIVGNMSILTAGRDLVPYLPTIMPDLQVAMTDPVPQTCAVACKALGVLVEKLGEEYFPTVIPDMLDSLKSNDPRSVGNRWGTAQGLAEVLHGLGTTKLDELLPEIVANCQSPQAHIRQSFVPLLLLLPGSFGASLTPYLDQLVTPLLRGLADQLDDVRDNALKAGRRIVRGYATIAIDLLLPELEKGLWSPSWRIRLASVELVGDLLMELLGKGPNVSTADRMKALADAPPTEDGEVAGGDDADHAEAEADEKQSGGYVESNLRDLEILGTARRDRVLSSIFVCRADVVAAVRQAALDMWLALIQNTPRAVKLILPTLVLMLVKRLGDEEEELQANAARALAELVRRVSGALKLILPTFLQHLSDHDARQGICLGLVELIPATQAQALQDHEQELMHLVRTCLQDSNTFVREAATRALEELHEALGDVSGDMLPEMAHLIVTENDEGSLAAIKEMLATTGATSVLAAALPPLLKSDLDEFKANAIAELCTAASAADISMYVEDVVDRLISTPYSAALDAILVRSCPESHLLSLVKNEEQLRSQIFSRMASYYAALEKVDMLFVYDWVVFALHGLEHAHTSDAAEELLRSISSSNAITKSDLARLATTAYRTLQLLAAPIPAFASSAKGPAFVLPFFLQGLSLGSNLEKEQSALAISEIIRRTDPVEKLKPVVTQITGPLIRIVGERTAPDVKAAIIYTLNELLTAIPAFLKPFLPQLQRTFAKNLSDQSSLIVRTRSAMALGSLIKLQTRIDPLAKEIITGVRTSQDAGVRTAFLTALHEIVCHAGVHLTDPVKQSVVELIADSEVLLSEDNSSNDTRQLSLFARIGADMVALSEEEESPKKLVESLIARKLSLQSVLNANALFVHAPKVAGATSSELGGVLEAATRSSTPVLSENGVSGLGKLLLNDKTSSKDGSLKPYEQSAVRALVSVIPASEDHSVDTRRLSVLILGALVAHHATAAVLQPFLNDLIPPLFVAARDRNIPVKIAAEKTFLAAFDFVGRHDSVLFDEWFGPAKESLDDRMQRSLSEYVRRVALRAAERDQEENDDDTVDELSEVWVVGLE